ncbi:MAG TPA: hypothetical protein VIR03_01285 [Candidatus Saccharimonadales bacterium]
MAKHAPQETQRSAQHAPRHATYDSQCLGSRSEHRAVYRTAYGAIALIAVNALLGSTAAPAEAPTVSERTVALQLAIEKAPPTQAPDTTPKRTAAPNADEFGRAACPAPKQELVKKYLTTGHIATNTQLPRFDTSKAITEVNLARSKAEILSIANHALQGSIEMHLATRADFDAPTKNATDTDQPLPTRPSDVSLSTLRATVTGVMQGYDGLPLAIGNLNGQTHMVLTTGFKTPDNSNLAGEYYGDQHTVALRIDSDPAIVTMNAVHELGGHGAYQYGAGTPNKVNCYADPALRMPKHLTSYALGIGVPGREQNPGTQEAEADAMLIGLGFTTPDESPLATTDAANPYNLAVTYARLADHSPLGEQLADALHNMTVGSFPNVTTQDLLALAN